MDPVRSPPDRPPQGEARSRAPPPILEPPRLPAAARPALSSLFTVTLLSAVDGSLLALAAQGALDSTGGALVVGLTVIAGAGSWVAARNAFAGRRLDRTDHAALAFLGLATLAATAGAVWLGSTLASALTLHVLPKAAGVVLWLVAAEVAGARLPRPGRVPLAALVVGAGAVAEVAVQWTR